MYVFLQVVVVDSWKKWLNFVSSVYVMIECIEKKIRSDFVNDDLRNGYALSLSLSGISLWDNVASLLFAGI